MLIDRRRLMIAGLGASAAGVGMTLPGLSRAQGGRDDVLRIVWPYDTSSLDPTGVGVQRSTWGVSVHLYDRLVAYAAKDLADGQRAYDPDTLVPELAERWDVSEGGRKITFFLRRNATFHDGSPVTAEDVVWSIRRALNVPAAAGVMRVGALTSPDQIRALDDFTVQVTLPEPNRFGVSVFAIPFAIIINRKLAEKGATPQDPWANDWLRHNAAGGGAYRLESFRPDQVVLVPNDAWVSGPKPALRQVNFQTVPEATTRVALVERGSADIAIEIPQTDLEAVAQRNKARVVAIPMPNQMEFLAFDTQAAPFSDVRVRQAVAYALPYDQIFKTIFRGKGTPLFAAAADPVGGKFPQAHKFKADLNRAKALLAEAGQGSGFSTSLAYSQSKAAFFDPLALVIRDALGGIGIRVSIERLPGAQFDERVNARTLPMMLENRVAWLSRPDYWFRAFYTGKQTSNLGNYQSPKLEGMLQDLKGDAAPADYDARTAAMSKLVLEEIPLLPLRQGAFELVMAPRVKGYTYWFHGLPDARNIARS
ncbi:ABC transporter substrate-binding protein [Bradyrhizobium elkanii]|uniref:ABC transporter substrate-binding protein n=1 Tax=Bradyrhizobium elkanii TaxID=29448 RepID=UPI003516287C